MKTLVYLEDVINEIKSFDNCGLITRSVNHVCEDMRTEVKEVKAIPIERLEQIKTEIKKEMEFFPDGETYISTDMVLNIINKAIKEQNE